MKLFSLVLSLGVSALGIPATAAPQKLVNLLFIITDQQRWDAMSCAGNKVIQTPNLDRLAHDGARFTSFYSACPVCVPARTAIFTGHDIYANHVLNNNDAHLENEPPFPSFDQILLRHGYRGEYHGKFHSPYKLALDYSQPVRWLNGPRPVACKADISESAAFFKFVGEHVPKEPLKPGQLASDHGPYTPIPLDVNYGKPAAGKPSQAEMYGRLDVPAGCSLAAYTAAEGIAALDRLKNGPFTLTISIGPPHPPMVVSDPYFSLYPPETIPVSGSIRDPLSNSPYNVGKRAGNKAYRNPADIRQMTSIYYGMISEDDEWVGKILQRLAELGLADHTLVIFTSDHGEMLGDHGLHGKAVFCEGAAHISLLMRLPGVIPASTVVTAPCSHLDLFPTILDYLGQKAPPTPGKNLRPLIESQDGGEGRFVVSEWPSKVLPGFMVFDGRWKFLCGQTADAPSLDALYDLKSDPLELNNLIGRNPDREKYRVVAERMKRLLIEWLTRVNSPHLESVKARPLFNQVRADGKLP